VTNQFSTGSLKNAFSIGSKTKLVEIFGRISKTKNRKKYFWDVKDLGKF
jgi:hypothetical protein